MFQLRKVVVRGPGMPDASLEFVAGGNILAGLSDTGKSYLVHCLDYIFGADKLEKRFPESEPYDQLYVQFANAVGSPLTLYRPLSGGSLLAYNSTIDDVAGRGDVIVHRRFGKSIAKDITSVLFPFAHLSEAQLRKNSRGETQRLTMRHWMPETLVDEVAVIDERSPVRGRPGYDLTANERAFAYMLAGRDDAAVVSAERNDVIAARLQAKISVVDRLLKPLQDRATPASEDTEDSIERVETAITELSAVLEDHAQTHGQYQDQRRTALEDLQKAESQIIALDELLARYRLLEARYTSDLDRLDFIAEGSHYLDGLQTVSCPLCEQPMTGPHDHGAVDATLQEAARAEAAKILSLRADLTGAIENVEARQRFQSDRAESSRTLVREIDEAVAALMTPTLRGTEARMRQLIERRVTLETARSDRDQLETLTALRSELERDSRTPRTSATDWEPLPGKALDDLCTEIEAVLVDWGWPGKGKVTFNQETYDIVIDGQPRQSHGKGVRGVLYSAFSIGLLNFCRANQRPHPGMVVIDSPLTAFSKRKRNAAAAPDGAGVDPGVEARFWASLTRVPPDIQIIVVENKAPPDDVAAAVKFTWFAGEFAEDGERYGFFPVRSDASG
ncbi:MAG: hypothetical protein KKA16_03550 [Alphaproteobacteria bacterium]|nr:hypothetical protein [Alphaproteobacteria bacterium]MBU2378044.1 hypothetical protein [Alphaproteobacteria bacterium]